MDEIKASLVSSHGEPYSVVQVSSRLYIAQDWGKRFKLFDGWAHIREHFWYF